MLLRCQKSPTYNDRLVAWRHGQRDQPQPNCDLDKECNYRGQKSYFLFCSVAVSRIVIIAAGMFSKTVSKVTFDG